MKKITDKFRWFINLNGFNMENLATNRLIKVFHGLPRHAYHPMGVGHRQGYIARPEVTGAER